MHAYRGATESPGDQRFALPSDDLRIAVTFKRPGARTNQVPAADLQSSIDQFVPDRGMSD
jgi:hypothetical protein